MSNVMSPMERTFANRDALIDYIRQQFPAAAERDSNVSATQGGSGAAITTLRAIDPARYAKTRNRLDGAVTHLSPYLRHGVLSMPEVREAAIEKVDAPHEAAKLINELGWRDYFQRVYRTIGNNIWRDLETYKTGFDADVYSDELPNDVADGTTGLACIDAFSTELRETGYLHNHIRMWLAAYLVHWRRVRWQRGARWFLTHLLDGDPASNNLSWQWVASTFSAKPYTFNREMLEKLTDGRYCRACPLYGHCELDAPSEVLHQRLFPNLEETADKQVAAQRTKAAQSLAKVEEPIALAADDSLHTTFQRPLIWVHGDCLDPNSPPFQTYPDAPAIWVWDDELLAEWEISLKRLVFLYECLLELPVVIHRGNVVASVLQFAEEQGADAIITVDSPSPRFTAFHDQIAAEMPIQLLSRQSFVTWDGALDLRRFSRYWHTVKRVALRR